MKHIDIFYADDDQDDINFFTDAVEKISSDLKISIKLHVFNCGESFLEEIRDNSLRNGIIFLDINMPKKTGFEVLEEIRNHPEGISNPVIMYSTSYDERSIKQSQISGASKYVVKPYNFNDLIKMIAHIITINWQEYRVNAENFIYSKKLI